MSHRNQSGFSLLELIVVITIIGAVMVPLSTFMIRGMTSYQLLENQSNTSTDLSILSGRLARVIRGATSVDTAQAGTLIIYGYFSPQDTVIKKIRYFASGSNLNIGVTPPSGTAPNYTYSPADEVVNTAQSNLTLGTTPMFTYYDETGNQLPLGFATSQIKQIGIYVSADPNTKQLPIPPAISTKVTLRNLKTNL